jgi:putative integral membrane protein (TIGR02587 family)
MASSNSTSHAAHTRSDLFIVDLARAYGGAILFSFPILMTMEMWWQGFSMSPIRLLIFTVVAIPLLIGLSYYDGFEDTYSTTDDLRETFIAFFVGVTASAVMLYLFGVLSPEMSWQEKLGKISVQALTASLGAMFAGTLLRDRSGEESEKRKRKASYWGQMFLTIVGALFLSMSVAATEEMVLIAYQMNHRHALGLIVVTLLVMHAFISAAENQAQAAGDAVDTTQAGLFIRYTVVSYIIVLAISYYVLWTFGSIDGMDAQQSLETVIVLGFPGGVGGSASRLIL